MTSASRSNGEVVALSVSPNRQAAFWSKVDAGPPDACWPWKGQLHSGYGSFFLAGRSMGAHRASFCIANGYIPTGLHVDHKCRNRACVNPGHLRAVTSRVNTLENSNARTAINAQKTHCDNGHPLTPDNLRRDKRGWRQCLTCHRKYTADYRLRLTHLTDQEGQNR